MSTSESPAQAFDLTYNTEKSDLVISEYGRHIQKLVKYACTIEDKKERQNTAEAIVELMYQMHPYQKKTDDYMNKLWNHLLRISDYQLDVETPDGVITEREVLSRDKEHMPYPEENKRFRHYGRYVQDLIDKAIAMPDGEKKQEFVDLIGSYMKEAYINWNQNSQNTKDVSIKRDLEVLSGNNLTIDEDANFDIFKATRSAPQRQNSKNKRKKNNKSNYQNKRRSK